jgi:tRNA pseudouridine38-40 synthase
MDTIQDEKRGVALLSEYNGQDFFGWQIQPSGRTVQQEIQNALIRLTGEPTVKLIGCSRTDSGVHARGHVSCFQTQSRIPVDRWPLALNRFLPLDISVREAAYVPRSFHARYDAQGKIYCYQIWNHPVRPALDRQHLVHVPGPIDLEAMQKAIPYFVGEHDFIAFSDAGGTKKTTRREIRKIRLVVEGPRLSLFIYGNAFLYHMVRIIVGTLLAVAQKKQEPDNIPFIFQSKDRRKAGKTMPPGGLCLEHVFYEPPLFGLWPEIKTGERDRDVQYTVE